MLDFSKFDVLTFDCYGTLIDWESGIQRALRGVLKAHGRELSDAEIVALYSQLERELESGEYRPYREVLQDVVRGFGQRLRFTPSEDEARSLPESLRNWKPFRDTVPALRRLKKRYRLAVISNIDDDLFAATARQLQVPFDAVITAEQARSYKPSPDNFRLALDRLGVPAERVLHVAESLFHDVAPARRLGLASVWVNRHPGRHGASGTTRLPRVRPDLEVPELKSLAAMAVPGR